MAEARTSAEHGHSVQINEDTLFSIRFVIFTLILLQNKNWTNASVQQINYILYKFGYNVPVQFTIRRWFYLNFSTKYNNKNTNNANMNM